MKYAAVVLVAVLGVAATCNESSDDSTQILTEPPRNHVYDSGDLGVLTVNGAPAEANIRFTLAGDEVPIHVTLEADYAPAQSNAVPASCELSVFDTKGDQDPSNDTLVGRLPPSSPFSRATLSLDTPGEFTIRTPLGVASLSKTVKAGGTYSVRLSVTTTGWIGTLSGIKIHVQTLKGVQLTPMPSMFLRDN